MYIILYLTGFYPIIIAASQMWLLGQLLPLMIGEQVTEEDPHWVCYINLLRILCIVTAVEITEDAISILQMLIEDYLDQFTSLYPNSITYKIHSLIHLPRQIKL